MADGGGYGVGLRVLREWYGDEPKGTLLAEAGSDYQAMNLFCPADRDGERRVLAARLALRLWLQILAPDAQELDLRIQGRNAQGEVILRQGGALLEMLQPAVLACTYDTRYAIENMKGKGSFGRARIAGRDGQHRLSFQNCQGKVRAAAKKALAMQDILLRSPDGLAPSCSPRLVESRPRPRF